MRLSAVRLIFLLGVYSALGFAQPATYADVLTKLNLPAGFKVSVFADELPNARSLALGDEGVVFVGTGAAGDVYAVQDSDNDGVADKRYTIAKELFMPNGVAFKDGALYVAEVNRIIRFDKIGDHLAHPPAPAVVYDKLPSDKHHGWKYLKFGPDGKLYSAIGAPCNICDPGQPYGTLFRVARDGSQFEVIAQGIRNSVGFDWQPGTAHLFFNDNGRDYLGDDLPPEELNRWSKTSEHFGYPYCHAGDIPDPEFGKDKSCRDYTAPAWKYKAHIAPLGMHFYTGKQFPVEYRNQLFVAQHGSWNRSKPDGYRIALIKFKDGKPVFEDAFLDGWLQKDATVIGRPVDILELPSGSLLISDDQTGVIYKIDYTGR